MEELQSLAKAITQRNTADAEIARTIGRPAERGHAGEYIAAATFGIELEQSASKKGIDGHFTSGSLAGKTVNIKWYGKWEGILDISPENGPDFYLVMTGPFSASLSSRGSTRPWLISYIFLFDSTKLFQDLKNVKLGIATSVKKQLWEMAEIYPTQRNSQLILSAEQQNILKLFGEG
ncbi:MAG: hypothetical protein A2Z69_01585 [Bacteroidetes bacterium RBG_13_44_24]|nr:MAG: hypothetical protein A2Z69_01585 [Bacteroidetes bacterium RBG_13_44_24]